MRGARRPAGPLDSRLWRHGRTTTSDELERWARDWVPGFRGVWARDAWEPPTTAGTSDLINLDDSDGPGTHWVAVRLLRDQPIVGYSDPYGLPPPREVTLACWRRGTPILYSSVPYQSLDAPHETNCGQRSLAWLYQLATAPDDWRAFLRSAEDSEARHGEI